MLKSESEFEQVRARDDHVGSFPPSILEGFVDFAFEASILVAGNGKDYVTFPIVRNEHRNNILHMTIAPAEVDETVAKEAHELALRLAKGFELAGILAIELFITKDNKVIVNELAPKFEVSDGLVIASPVYFASANATLIACLDRLFYSTSFDKTMKVGASVVCARRGGCSAAFDELNKFFTVSNMPVVSSQYWNSVHGRDMGEAVMDEEGLQTMRTLANNMTFLMKSIALGKEAYGLPEKEPTIHMNFVR